MWKRVTPTPPPYLEVFRCEFSNGLQVLLLIRRAGDRYEVLSCTDHNTRLPTEDTQGRVSTLPEAEALLHANRGTWDEFIVDPVTVGQPPQRLFYYLDDSGRIGGPITREAVFDLVGKGILTWTAQISEKPRGMLSASQWEPILRGLGFPVKE